MKDGGSPNSKHPGVDSPFFSAIVLFKNQPFPQGFGGFLERRIPGKNGEVIPRKQCCENQKPESQDQTSRSLAEPLPRTTLLAATSALSAIGEPGLNPSSTPCPQSRKNATQNRCRPLVCMPLARAPPNGTPPAPWRRSRKYASAQSPAAPQTAHQTVHPNSTCTSTPICMPPAPSNLANHFRFFIRS